MTTSLCSLVKWKRLRFCRTQKICSTNFVHIAVSCARHPRQGPAHRLIVSDRRTSAFFLTYRIAGLNLADYMNEAPIPMDGYAVNQDLAAELAPVGRVGQPTSMQPRVRLL